MSINFQVKNKLCVAQLVLHSKTLSQKKKKKVVKLTHGDRSYESGNFWRAGDLVTGKNSSTDFFLSFFYFFLLGLEHRAYTLSHSTSPFFVCFFFKIRSLKLFAWAGFESRSS
jgi:hypothetical protein